MTTSTKPETPSTPAHPTAHDEGMLDEALDASFPASDPAAAVTPDADASDAEERALDEALKDSFPASDPPAPVQPGEN